MVLKSADLIDELSKITADNVKDVKVFQTLSIEELNQKPNAESWSILECIEHLNRYGDFYIPVIKEQLEKSKLPKSDSFKSGILGNYFAKSMLPSDKMKKIKTFKSMNPANSELNHSTLEKFLLQQNDIFHLLQLSKEKNLTKIKTPISFTKWIKLKLGDTFRVVIYHNLRHVVQAKNVLN